MFIRLKLEGSRCLNRAATQWPHLQFPLLLPFPSPSIHSFNISRSSSAACLFTGSSSDGALRAAQPLSYPPFLLSLSPALDLSLSIWLFLGLKGFCERHGMKGCPQWERDCRDSAGGLRYQNYSRPPETLVAIVHSLGSTRTAPCSSVNVPAQHVTPKMSDGNKLQ